MLKIIVPCVVPSMWDNQCLSKHILCCFELSFVWWKTMKVGWKKIQKRYWKNHYHRKVSCTLVISIEKTTRCFLFNISSYWWWNYNNAFVWHIWKMEQSSLSKLSYYQNGNLSCVYVYDNETMNKMSHNSIIVMSPRQHCTMEPH